MPPAHGRIPVYSGPRLLEFVHTARAEYLATRINVVAVRARKTKAIVRLNIQERIDTPDLTEQPFQDSNVTTFRERLFQDDAAAPAPGQRILVQHKGIFCPHSWLDQWAEIQIEEMAEVLKKGA